MWLATRYGWFSIARTKDQNSFMIRARIWDHLDALRLRFLELEGQEIVTTPDNDYWFRLMVSPETMIHVVTEFVKEQVWDNFKDEAARFQRYNGMTGEEEYIDALHNIWGVMKEIERDQDG